MATGNYQFSITEYKTSATYITDKMKQDSFYMSQLESSFVPKMNRALQTVMETDVLAIGVNGQTASNPNSINGADHRLIASGTSQVLVPKDFARAKYALRKAYVPLTNLVAIVDPSVEYALSTMTNLSNVIYNPQWEGIVRTGMSTGMRFIMNIYGFDVYTSDFLPDVASESINSPTFGSASVTNGKANIFFSAAGGDTSPFIGAVRETPSVESERNKDLRRDEYVMASRYGFGFYRPENFVTIFSSPSASLSTTI